MRNPELEALIEEAPNDPDRYLVYADWLQQQGDPRGELIAVQHQLATTTSNSVLNRLDTDETRIMTTYAEQLLGRLAEYVLAPRAEGSSRRVFNWHYGFIRAARLSMLHQPDLALSKILGNPSGHFLQRLIVGDEGARDFARIVTEHAPRVLHQLVLRDSDNTHYAHFERHSRTESIDFWWTALPRLRQLLISGPASGFSGGDGSDLERLHLASASEAAIAELASVRWPKLTRLHLTLGGSFEDTSVFAKPLRALLRGSAMPALKHVSLSRWLMRSDARVKTIIPQDVLAREVLGDAALRKLERIDLEIMLSPDGVEHLRHESLRAIGKIGFPKNLVRDRAQKTALPKEIPNLEWLEAAPVEPELGVVDPLY